MSYISNNFRAAISEYKGILLCEGYDYKQGPEDISKPLPDPFFTRTMKLLSRPDGFMLYGKLGIDFFSTSELLYSNMKIRLRLIRARPKFYLIRTTPLSVLELWIAHFTLILLLSRKIITKKEWTCSPVLLWNTFIWRHWQRQSTYLRDKTNSIKKTFSTMLPFDGLLLQ